MNRVATLVLVTVGILSAPARAMTWADGSFEQALQRAKAGNKWVLVDVYATWCGPCHQLDAEVWPREEVGRALEPQFVPLRRDGEEGEGAALAKRYHVVGFPTVLVIDSAGNEVDRVMGFQPASEMVQTLTQLRAGKHTLADLEHKLAANPHDEALRLEVGTRHAMRGDAHAVEELTAVVAGDAKNENKRAAQALLTLGKYYYLRGQKDDAHALQTLRELEKRFPSSEQAGEAGYNEGLALHHLKQDAEARRVLDAWIAAAPKDVDRYNAYAWLCFKNDFDRARGIEVAKKGLQLDPKNDGLWDTLAELYAATGKRADARDAEAHALALKPGDTYYTAQQRKLGGGS